MVHEVLLSEPEGEDGSASRPPRCQATSDVHERSPLVDVNHSLEIGLLTSHLKVLDLLGLADAALDLVEETLPSSMNALEALDLLSSGRRHHSVTLRSTDELLVSTGEVKIANDLSAQLVECGDSGVGSVRELGRLVKGAP